MKNLVCFLLLFVLFSNIYAENLKLWISSHQDKIYYEKMVKLYQKQVNSNFMVDIQAFGFREMPDKLATVIKTGEGTPDIVQLDEIFFSMYLSDQIPFADLTERTIKSGLHKNLLKQRLDLFKYKNRLYGLPQSLSAVILFCRKDLLDRYNLTTKDLKSWDTVLIAGKRLAKQKQRLMALDWSYFEILVRQRGGQAF